jgi:hypothetical protein
MRLELSPAILSLFKVKLGEAHAHVMLYQFI